MFRFLLNRHVGSRLTLAFSLVLLLMLGLGVTALVGMSSIQGKLDHVVQQNGRKTELVQSMLDGTRQVAILMRNSVLRNDPDYSRQQIKQLKELRAQFERDKSALEKLPVSPRGRQLRDQTYTARTAAKKINDEVLRLAANDQTTEARELLVIKGTPAMQAWADPLLANMKAQVQANADDYAAAQFSYNEARAIVIAIAAIALALGAVLAWLITRSLTLPLLQASKTANDIAQGRLDGSINPEGKDEVADLLRAMKDMQAVLRQFASSQQEMAARHDAGEIDFRMPSAQFKGAYAQLAEGVNTLVGSHIGVTMRIVEVVSAYAKGDLSMDIERYPGQKARITDAIDAIKAGMLAVNGEIKDLVDAAVAGDFSYRANVDHFQFAYRDLILQLNQLMVTADNGFGEVGSLLSALADGDLGQRIETLMPGQFGQLATDANQTASQLAQVVGGIRQAADAINAAAQEIAAGNSDLSRRTEGQAASLEETAASMEELTATVKQNADNARQANGLAQGATDVAQRGGDVVNQVVDTMGRIQQASQRIGDIIGTIDGIAFQTNILALNAAVEAARAGEQGRGFAVVATEVRALAQRSAAAAREIKQLITDSVTQISEGSQLVDAAGKTMHEIVGSVRSVTALMAEINAASQEQSAGIEQVNLTITQMDEGTQHNAALVEEATASAESLRHQAGALVDAIAAFRGDHRHAQLASAA